MRVRMHRVVNGSALRTDVVEGDADDLPIVGRPFVVVGEALTPGYAGRLVVTSRVARVYPQVGGSYRIMTENSTYVVETVGPEKSGLASN